MKTRVVICGCHSQSPSRRIEDTIVKDAAAHELTITLSSPDMPPHEMEFRRWVQQSINLAARNLFHELYSGAILAANPGVAYGTRSELRFKALRLAVKSRTSVPIRTANAFINLDLPFINDLDIERVMQIRREEGEAFDNFRHALDFKRSALQGGVRFAKCAEDCNRRRPGADRVQLHDVDLKMRSLREKPG